MAEAESEQDEPASSGDGEDGSEEKKSRGRSELFEQMGAGAAEVRGDLSRAGRAAARKAREAGGHMSEAWFGLSLLTRQRLAAGAAFVLLILIVAVLVVPNAPCWVPGGSACPPSDDAVALVPADSDGYLHANLDPGTEQGKAAGDAEARFADLSPVGVLGDNLLGVASGKPVDYRRDVAPWSTGEIAAAFHAGFGSLDSAALIEIAGQKGAEKFADGYLPRRRVSTKDVEGVTVSSDARGNAVAIAGGYVVIGTESEVDAVVTVAGGKGSSLEKNDAYEQIAGELPDDSAATGWLSPGLAKLAFGPRGPLSGLDTLVNSAAGKGLGAALSFGDGTVDLAVRSAQDPHAPAGEQDVFAALPEFEPSLADDLGADTIAYLGLGDPAADAGALITRAGDAAPKLFKGLRKFDRNLQNKDNVDLGQELLPTLDGESALTLEPQAERGSSKSGSELADQLPPPYLALLATDVDTQKALSDLADLQDPIAAEAGAGSKPAPIFTSTQISGVEAHSLELSPVVNLTYAGWDDKLVIGTSPVAVSRARSDDDPLSDSSLYQDVVDGLPDSASALLYVNSRELVSLAERLLLGEDPAYAQIAPDLRALTGLGVAVRSSDDELDTDARITVGEQVAPQQSPAVAQPGGD